MDRIDRIERMARQRLDAFDEGVNAHDRGVTYEECPYADGESDLQRAWKEGWVTGSQTEQIRGFELQ